ncbi:uncharacterized protein AB675_1053 [Cyphellophora attinorum]|uniref:Uncharacterized protein n=1 Tax=Cyphellophora attinorum TaxID=1664694 RepID=A0A0N0NKK1_9EURO|nr:uncharacterized protein AB675_1053 [Phialophora attinorum]KPI38118.1 hypothetical protein AB675_1053 [Phialophora attinorum]
MRTAAADTMDLMSDSMPSMARSDGKRCNFYTTEERKHIISLICKRNGLLSYLEQLSETHDIKLISMPQLFDLDYHGAAPRLLNEIEFLEERIAVQCNALLEEYAESDWEDLETKDVDMDMDDQTVSGESLPETFEDGRWMFDEDYESVTVFDNRRSKRKRLMNDDSDEDWRIGVENLSRIEMARQRVEALRP